MTVNRDTAPSRGWGRRTLGKALGKLWAEVISLPDRGQAATHRDVPQEFFRYPPL